MPKRRNISTTVHIPAGTTTLHGSLQLSLAAQGMVVFVHGSGSSRLSPRNRYIADSLGQLGFGTLLFDLLTESEADDRERVFDIPLLALRVVKAVEWLQAEGFLAGQTLGLFGASTGAAAALVASNRLGDKVDAIVSRGGRPDLAWHYLREVTAPTLLIVGGDDQEVLELNRSAYANLSCAKSLVIIPHATHLFEEPGALERVAAEAGHWFVKYLKPEQQRNRVNS